jgi:hypothetical protein
VRHTPPRNVVAVCGDSRRAELFDALLADGYDCDVIFVDSIARGYSRVKELRPDMVVIFTLIDDPGACQLLSMLTVDRDTKGIPILTCATKHADPFDALLAEIDGHVSCAVSACPMN